MANLSQSIPSYLGGISQQPDYNKSPGMLSDLINGYPDITYGLRKRPGLKFEFTLDDTSKLKGGRWFSIAKPGEFPYFGVILPDDTIRIWNGATRTELTLEGTTPYIKINDKFTPLTRASFEVVTIQNVTVVLNKNCKVLEDTAKTPGTLTGTVTTFADLGELTDPSEGDIYKILNTASTKEDDYYVQYTAGAWTECVAPGISVGIDSSTMPHIIGINPLTNQFSLIQADNINRAAGDDNTNGMPSFVGTTINGIFFYLNRVGYLSRDNVFLSQPIIPDNVNTVVIQKPNYFNSSAVVQVASDPVDLNVATIRPVELINALPAYNGLALFSTGEQFVMYSQQGVITPQTAVIKSISNYEQNPVVNAIELGEKFIFISKTQRNTRTWQLEMQGIEQEPVLTDIGKIITDYIPNNVDTLVSSPQNQFFSLSSTIDNKMYLYRRFVENNEIQFKSWFRWDMPGNIQICAFFDDRMFIATETGGKTVISSASLNLVPEEDILTNVPYPDGVTNSGEGVGPYLDLWLSDGTSEKVTINYDTVTPRNGDSYAENITFTLPTTYPSKAQLEPCVIKSKDILTRSTLKALPASTGYSPKVTINTNGTWTIEGRYELSDVNAWVLGYRYNYDLLIPQTYLRTESGTDIQAFLNIDRYKFVFKETAEVTFKLKSLGNHTVSDSSSFWSDIVPAADSDFYRENTFPYATETTLMLPIHRKNLFFKLRIFDNSPFPCTLSGMSWEGFYNPRYYRRA